MARTSTRRRRSTALVRNPAGSAAPNSCRARSSASTTFRTLPPRSGFARASSTVVTRRQPSEQEWEQLGLAWTAVKHVKSNAIVLFKDCAAVGVGAGQMSRVEAVQIAVRRAGERARGAVMASDAFFPFADGLEEGIRAGVTAAIQPGGSMKDDEVIAAADAAGIAMVVTGRRHFKH